MLENLWNRYCEYKFSHDLSKSSNIDIEEIYVSGVTWVSLLLKSPATPLFVKSFFRLKK